MTTPTHPLPDQWTINLRPALGLTILTLLDGGGTERLTGFHPLAPPGTTDRTVSTLEEIADEALRVCARNLVDAFHARTAQAQTSADAFGAAVPDQSALFDRLRADLAGALVDLGIDDTLTVVLTLAAEGPGAGSLLSLIARWSGSRPQDGSAEGITRDLDDAGCLTVLLDQTRAEQFLIWYRDRS
ncbi:hypothetical protein [Embleya sp. MST-111070]|uniref:hypothetical protein n=1 Tax=Embleya sp. MST-111070 TaxID=3398231 RepID=UPI003F731547